MTAQRTRTILRVFGYIVFFMACFAIFLMITFPYDRLTGYAEGQIEKALGVEANIDRLRPTIFGGVRLEGLTLGPALPTKGAPPPTSSSPYVRVDEAVVSVSLLGLLLGWVDTDFEAELAGGEAEGWFEQDETHVALQLKLLGVQAKSLPILREKVGLPVGGTLSADIEFDVPVGKAIESTGSFTLTLQGGVIGDGEAKLSLGSLMGYGKRSSTSSDEGTLIQPIKLGPIALQSKMVKGELEFPRVEAVSEHAELSFEGRVKLAEPLSQSRIDTYLTVKLTDAYAQQDETTETLVSIADTVGRQAKRSDGAFGFRISGSFLRGLSFRPSKNFSLPGTKRSVRDRAGRNRAGRERPGPPNRRMPPRRPNGPHQRAGDGEQGNGRPAIGPRPSIVAPANGPSFPRNTSARPAPPPPSVTPPGGEEIEEEQEVEQEVEDEVEQVEEETEEEAEEEEVLH